MWWLPLPAVAAAPPHFVEVPPPGPPPHAWGPYWRCSLAAAAPVCSRLADDRSGGPRTVEPWTHPTPPGAGKLAQLVGLAQGPISAALDGDGVVWVQGREGWVKAPETRGTTRIASNGGLLCGTTASGAWCGDTTALSERETLAVGPVAELVVDRFAAGFVARDGRVAVVHHPMDAVGGLAEHLTWFPALKGVQSLAVLDAMDLACGVSAEGRIVCAAFAAPAQPISFGSDLIGAGAFYQDNQRVPVEGVRFTAVQTSGVAMLALADDGRIFVFRPPDSTGDGYAAEGVALVGNGCIERRSGPWWCLW